MESPLSERVVDLDEERLDDAIASDEEPSNGREIFINYGNNRIVRISLESPNEKDAVEPKRVDPLEFIMKAINFTGFYIFIFLLLINKAFGISETIVQPAEGGEMHIQEADEPTSWKGFLSNIFDIYILMSVKIITALSSISVYAIAVIIEVFVKEEEKARKQ